MSDTNNGIDEPFISEQQHKDNLSTQLATSPQTVEQLQSYGITEDRMVKLEYFFYTNTVDKAAALSSELSAMGYNTEVEKPDSDKKIRIVAGSSAPIQMATETVLEWTETMCDTGYSHDCEFDGWGISPEQ